MKTYLIKSLLLVSYIVSTGIVTDIQAQWYDPGTFNGMANIALNGELNRITINTGTSGNTTRKKEPASSGTAPKADLSYTPSVAVQQEVIKAVADEMGNGDTARARIIYEGLKRSNAINSFSILLKNYNFDALNLADVFSAYILLSWEMVTDKDASRFKKGISIYQDIMHREMQKSEKIATWDNAKKQQVAQRMILLAFMAQEAIKGGRDASIITGVQNKVKLICGVDVALYDLSDKGFRKL